MIDTEQREIHQRWEAAEANFFQRNECEPCGFALDAIGQLHFSIVLLS
jgi:hypothetical protein